jgi:glycosyltransferase involved in cell wall biosynthesis
VGDAADPHGFTFSIVVPVFNSADVVGRTIDRIVEVFDDAGLRYQLVLVNDGSKDASWELIAARARSQPHVVAINLLRNYGQHHANLAGFREATGDYVITMDDDLQNPPDQALLLIAEAMKGHDVVFGRFERKQAPGYRRLGSTLISLLNRRVFAQPPGLAVSNFRILRRDVVDRICASRTAHPYVTGQALMYSNNPADVLVRHDPRPVGASNYGLTRILSLVFSILFSYSVFPLRVAAAIGFLVALGSFLLGGFYLVRSLFVETPVAGWTTIAVLLSVLNGVVIALLSMLGEYVVRTLNAVSSVETYHVTERVSS